MEKRKKEIFKSREKINIGEDKKELNEKEVANLLFESFKFSQGNIALQLMYLLSAYNYYGPQKVDSIKVRELFLKYLGNIDHTGEKGKVETGLSKRKMHIKMSDYNFEEMTKVENGSTYSTAGLEEFISVLKDGYATFIRYERDLNIVSVKPEELTIKKFLDKIVSVEFSFLALPKYETEKVGRPNRQGDAVGNNTLRDRFYSFFVWNILLGNRSGLEFSDKIYNTLRAGFVNWFNNLEPHKPMSYKYVPFGGGLKTKRIQGGYDDEQVTKDNVIELITVYNNNHEEQITEKMLKVMGCKF